MAHYAFLDENNVVVEVINGRDEHEVIDGISDWEHHYGNIRGLQCKRTSYNTLCNRHLMGGTPFRGHYAAIGMTYDVERDAFIPPRPSDQHTWDETILHWIPPQPYPSWSWSYESLQWEPPVAMPEQTGNDDFRWNEDLLMWEKHLVWHSS